MTHHDTLQVTAQGEREIVITRQFDAPRELVFRAMSEAELLGRWLVGPPGWSTVSCESDLRVGGAFRHVWRGPDGTEMAMRGTYREVDPPQRIVRTETFEFGCEPQAGEQLGTLRLSEDQPGRTTLHLSVLYPSKEARDGALASGMEHGMAAGYRSLDAILDGLASGR
jgi:uncharacterized protein YndB with AHSA1/START domain